MIDLHLQLQTVHKNDLLIEEDFVHIKSIVDQLATIGEIVLDQDLTICLI